MTAALTSLALLSALLLALFASGHGGASPFDAKPDLENLRRHAIKVDAAPLKGFARGDAGRTRFGRLIWLGGLVLRSPSPYFGGFSGLALGPRGERFVAVSDAGFWMAGRIVAGSVGGSVAGSVAGSETPQGLADVEVGPLWSKSGRPLSDRKEVDAEAVRLLTGTPQSGTVLVSFERIHRIGRFRIGPQGIAPPARYLRLPNYVRTLKANRGLEAVGVIRAGPLKGAVVTFAEGRRDSRGLLRGWLIVRGRAREVFLKPIGGFDITDIAGLPDGGLVVLERRFRWSEGVKMRIRRIAPGEIRAGAAMVGEVLLEADQSFNIDNMEGIAVHRASDGRTILTLISDDNFRFFQRTLLLRFAIAEREG